ncbi:unnamed protein product [Blepharisma stoltei]|uniref:CTLH domain-containing protein n=1 Tax=Blepharisma stoltei TaxID=1481888 RepID=A0AAU9J8J5_9CILI|nr:unnamed protein product [Blepharisma stoltei]
MANLSISKEKTIRLILQYLETNDFYRSVIEVEKDTKIRLRKYGKEIDFFYDLITDGRFDDAEIFITPLQERSIKDYEKVLFSIKKSKFLETLETSIDPKLDDLTKLIKDIETISSKEDFDHLCQILSMNKLADHPDYADWDIWKGRLNCFNECLLNLSEIYPILLDELPKTTLIELLGNLEDEQVSEECASVRISKESESQETASYKTSQNILEKMSGKPELALAISINSPVSRKKSKKVSFVAVADNDENSEDESKKFIIDELDPDSPGDEHSLSEYSPEPAKNTAQDLMNNFSPASLKEVARIEDSKPIRCSVFNVTGDYFALGTNTNSIRVCSMHNIVDGLMYDEHQGREQYIDVVFELRRPFIGSVYCIDWSRSESQIAAGYSDKNIRILHCPDFLTLQETQSQTVLYEEGKFLTGDGELPEIRETLLQGHQDIVRTVCFNPTDDSILLSGGNNEGDIKIWNTETSQCIQRLQGHKGSIFQIAAEGKGSYFVSVGTDRTLKLWDIRSNKCQMSILGESYAEMTSVALINSTAQLRTETKDKIANIFLKRSTNTTPQAPKQNLAAVGHADGMVTLWDINAGKLFNKYSYHLAECRGVDFSADRKWLVSCSFDRSIKVLDMANGTTYRLEYHDDRVVSVRWHPYLPILVSTSADKTARIFCP